MDINILIVSVWLSSILYICLYAFYNFINIYMKICSIIYPINICRINMEYKFSKHNDLKKY